MSNTRSYYETLGLAPGSSKDDVKAAYRKLAKQYHPDINKEEGASQKFEAIQEAYDNLNEPKSARRENQSYTTSDYINFEEILHNLKDYGKSTGQNVQCSVQISLEEACQGCTKEIEIPSNSICSVCYGNGYKGAEFLDDCSRCNGKGRVSKNNSFSQMNMVFNTVCADCSGRGKNIPQERICKDCDGKGLISNRKKVKIPIPAGIRPNESIICKGEGLLSSPKGKRGSLILNISFKQHNVFHYANDQLILDYPLTLSQAIQGVKVDIPTLYGKVSLNIPSGVENGNVFFIKDAGLMNRNGIKDMLIVRVLYEIPKIAKDQDLDLITKLESLEKEEKIPGYFIRAATIAEYLK